MISTMIQYILIKETTMATVTQNQMGNSRPGPGPGPVAP